METACLNETRYRIARALRIRGIALTIMEDENSFRAEMGVGGFTLTIMPGNRRVLISSHVFINPEKRGQGHGQVALGIREAVAKEAGCNLILATVRNDNVVEVHLLEKAGWRRFTNRDTGVSLWGKEL